MEPGEERGEGRHAAPRMGKLGGSLQRGLFPLAGQLVPGAAHLELGHFRSQTILQFPSYGT